MSTRREPSAPPRIPGYEHSRLLGMGGFADVFLYEQQMPRRSVAVKVLLASSLGDDVRERFRHEADLMARLSHHPSIVTIFHADVAPDGRPFLVMEYCSRAGLGQRYRTERMGVAEVLRIGVRLASAVETAHRAGILHRDIKPANVLVTDFGWPALTDFGIAATTGLAAGSAIGMSIPWSPPELLAENPHGDVRADIYSLAATVYSLLARRSPFEVPDGSNTAADLITRIERSPLAPTGRGDVPDSLQAVLERAMDRVPERRHHSALAFARALQQVEAGLMLPMTPLDLPEDVTDQPEPTARAEPDDDAAQGGQATRLRPVRSVSPDAPGQADGPAAGSAPVGAGAAHAGIPGPGPQFPPLGEDTLSGGVREAAPDGRAAPAAPSGVPEAWQQQADEIGGPAQEHERRRSPARVAVGVLAGVAVLAALTVGGVAAFRQDPAAPDPCSDPEAPGRQQAACDAAATPTVPAVRAVPSPADLVGTVTAGGSTVFTWTNPEPEEGDAYLWGVVETGSETSMDRVEEPTATVVPDVPGDEICVEVAIVRTDGRFSTRPAVGCAG
ncbi:MAG: serine/threonine protein kinase [Actinotalea sp.]|nr:serine/threonine protein kinase [Actinotalea sp.]